MLQSEQQEVAEHLQREWELQLPDLVSEQEILAQLEARVSYLIEKNPEGFFQLMYRLDVAERKVMTVLQEQDVALQIAKLIYQRQLQKIESRKQFRNDNIDKDLEW